MVAAAPNAPTLTRDLIIAVNILGKIILLPFVKNPDGFRDLSRGTRWVSLRVRRMLQKRKVL